MRRSMMRALGVLAVLTMSVGAQAADDWQSGAGENWKKLLEAARAEGKVVVAGDPDLAKPLSDGFKRDTGINVEFLVGSPRDIGARVTRELRAKTVTIDVMTGGPANIPLHKEKLMKNVRDQLILPTVTEPKYWTGGFIKWIDNDKAYMVMGAEYVHADPYYNIDKIKPENIRAWQDLMRPEYKGKIVSVDPRAQGSGQAAAAYIVHLFGYEFVRKLYQDQQVALVRDARQAIEWVARGSHWISIGTSSTDLEKLRASGIQNVGVTDMSDGPGSVLGGFSIFWEPVGAPHPNAAAVFLNWYASKPGQEAFMAAKGTPTRRTDVDLSSVPDYNLPKPGYKYLDQYQEDFLLDVRPKLEKTIDDIMGGR